MANITKYNSRIILKHDSYSKWQSIENSFIPLPGEIIVYDQGANPINEPKAIKIGDGTTVLKLLPFFTNDNHQIKAVIFDHSADN